MWPMSRGLSVWGGYPDSDAFPHVRRSICQSRFGGCHDGRVARRQGTERLRRMLHVPCQLSQFGKHRHEDQEPAGNCIYRSHNHLDCGDSQACRRIKARFLYLQRRGGRSHEGGPAFSRDFALIERFTSTVSSASGTRMLPNSRSALCFRR